MAHETRPDDDARGQRDATSADHGARPTESASGGKVPGKGTIIERDLFGHDRGTPSKVGQQTLIEKGQRADGTVQRAAGAIDEAAALLGVDLRLSRHEIKFPSTAVNAQSGPLSVHAHNRGNAPARVDGLVPISGDGEQFRAEGADASIAGGGSIEIGIAFHPTRPGPHRADLQLRAGGMDVPHQRLDVRGTAHAPRAEEALESAADNRIAIVRAGGALPPPITFDDMLAALRAAQQLTDAGAAQDAAHGRVDYDRAEALVAPVAARLDGLEARFLEFARQQGFARTTATSSFEGAHTAVKNWAGRLRGDSTINAEPSVTAFAQAKEIIQVLTGESKEAATLTALGHAARWTPLEIAGGVAAGAVVSAGVGAAAAAGADAVPWVASKLSGEWALARHAFFGVSGWVATHPEAAHELATWLGSIGVSVVDAGGVKEFFDQIQDWESFLNVLGQMGEPVVNHEIQTGGGSARATPAGEPTAESTNTRSGSPAPNNIDAHHESGRSGGANGASDAGDVPGGHELLARARALIDHAQQVADRARSGDRSASGPAPAEPVASGEHVESGKPSATRADASRMSPPEPSVGEGVALAGDVSPVLREVMGHERYEGLLAQARQLRQVPDLQPTLAALSDDEIVAMIGYTESDYRMLNGALRAGDVKELLRLGRYIAHTRNGLAALPDFSGPVYRGTEYFAGLSKYKVGAVIEEAGFTSASYDAGSEFGGSVEFVILSRHGKRIDFLSAFKNEKEVLFMPGTRFKILERTDEDGLSKITIKMMEMP
jgi:hypothetical protein